MARGSINVTGRSSSNARGFKARDYDPNKHPRDSKGRFINTADPVKPVKGIKSADQVDIARVIGKIHKEAKAERDIRRAKVELLSSMNRRQRLSLQQVLTSRQASAPAKPQPIGGTLPNGKARPLLKSDPNHPSNQPKQPSTKSKKQPGQRAVGRKTTQPQVEITDKGVTVSNVVHDPSFSKHIQTSYTYQATNPKESTNFTLSTARKQIRLDGEVVNGVPDLVGNPKSATTEQLARGLAIAQKGSKAGNAPVWVKGIHEEPIKNKQLIAKKGYGGFQIHHVNQWALDPAKDIEADFKAGKITAAQYRQRMVDALEMRYDPDKKIDRLTIKLAPKGQRDFVILPGGLHDSTVPKKLYNANHPEFLDPFTGKHIHVGIPYDTDSGRKWFNNWRGKFWKQYYRSEIQEIGTELDKRIKAGESHTQITAWYNEEMAKSQAY